MKTIKYFNKAIISYSFPRYYYGFLIFFLTSGTLFSHSSIREKHQVTPLLPFQRESVQAHCVFRTIFSMQKL